LNQLAV